MRKRLIVIGLVAALVLVACSPQADVARQDSGTQEVRLPTRLVTTIKGSAATFSVQVYEFTDAKNGKHCYVARSYEAVAIDCTPLEAK